jgi:hypothetical protein
MSKREVSAAAGIEPGDKVRLCGVPRSPETRLFLSEHPDYEEDTFVVLEKNGDGGSTVSLFSKGESGFAVWKLDGKYIEGKLEEESGGESGGGGSAFEPVDTSFDFCDACPVHGVLTQCPDCGGWFCANHIDDHRCA